MDVELFELSNGIRVVHRPVNSPVAHFGLFFAIGSRDENPEEEGLAHFMEHSLFKGTQRRKAYHILSRMEDVGGELNAFTSKEETVIHSSFLHSDYPRAIELIADIGFNSIFPQKEVEKEKEVIIDEIFSYKDSPGDSIFDDFEEFVFPEHSLGKNILGTVESVKSFSRQHILDFLAKHLHPERVIFSSVGKISSSRLKKLLENALAKLDINWSGSPRALLSPQAMAPVEKELLRPGYQTHIIIGGRAYESRNDKMRPLALLNNLLGGPGMNSRLNLNIRERYGFTYHLESFYHAYLDTGLFGIYLGTDPKNAERSIALVEKELQKLRDKKLGVLQLSKAKRQVLGQLAMAQENNGALMQAFGKSLLLHNEVEGFDAIVADVEKISAEDLQNVAQEILDTKQFSRLIYRNKPLD